MKIPLFGTYEAFQGNLDKLVRKHGPELKKMF